MAVATGLDIGHQMVRALVLERSGRNLRILDSAAVQRLDAEGNPRPVATVVAELDAIVRFRGQVVVADNDIGILVRFISTLPLPPDRLARLLRLELAQHADSSGDLAADTLPVPIAGDELMHCCVLAQPAQVYSTLIDLREAKATSASIHFGPAALYNATTLLPPVSDSDLAVLVDIGAKTCGITLFGDDRMIACRQIGMGGELFTEALVANGLDHAAAEQAKRRSAGSAATASEPSDPFGKMLEEGLPGGTAPPPPATSPGASARQRTTGDEFVVLDDQHQLLPDKDPIAPVEPAPTAPSVTVKDDGLFSLETPTELEAPAAPAPPAVPPAPAASAPAAAAPAELDPALTKAADVLFGHIIASLTWFKAQLKLRSIEPKMILLSGGAAATPGLAAYLARRLTYAVRIYDPLAPIELGRKPEYAHEWTTALGLALAAPALAQRAVVRLDLRPEGLIRRELWRTRLIWPYVAAGLLVVASVFLVLALHDQKAAERACLATYADYDQAYSAQKAELDQTQAQHDALTGDLRFIAARIYGGQTLLGMLRALKERTLDFKDLWITRLRTHNIGTEAHSADEERRVGDFVRTDDAAAAASTIDRGAVDISGKIKLSDTTGHRERDEILADWMKAVMLASPDDGRTLLFRDAKFINVLDRSRNTTLTNEPTGQSHWDVRFSFEPTNLALLTAPAVAPAER